jgi:hypothetical protein
LSQSNEACVLIGGRRYVIDHPDSRMRQFITSGIDAMEMKWPRAQSATILNGKSVRNIRTRRNTKQSTFRCNRHEPPEPISPQESSVRRASYNYPRYEVCYLERQALQYHEAGVGLVVIYPSDRDNWRNFLSNLMDYICINVDDEVKSHVPGRPTRLRHRKKWGDGKVCESITTNAHSVLTSIGWRNAGSL